MVDRAALFHDLALALGARTGLTSGVQVALVGRWAHGLACGQWAHANIALSPARPREVRTGWAFHLLVGGGGVALLYPALLQAVGVTRPVDHLWGGLAFGAITSLLPWLGLGAALALGAAALWWMPGRNEPAAPVAVAAQPAGIPGT